MATLPPPAPKKRKVTNGEEASETERVIAGNKSITVQFRNPETGSQFGPPVVVQFKDASVKNLTALLNNLQQEDDDPVPYDFYYRAGSQRVRVATSLQDALKEGLPPVSTETITLEADPQALFKVRPVTRCGATIPGHESAILHMQFSPSGSSRLVTGSGDSKARLWDCQTGTPLTVMKGHTDWVLAVSWSPDGTTIATGSRDGTVRLWTNTGEPIGNALKGHSKAVRYLSWEPFHLQTPGRPRLASASADSTVRIWDTTVRKADMVLSGHSGPVSCVLWSGDGHIYTASHDKTIRVWRAKDGRLHQTLSKHAHWVNHLSLSTGIALRTGPFDPAAKGVEQLDDVERAKRKYRQVASVGGSIRERLVSASDDCVMYLWEPSQSNQPIARLIGHGKPINHVAFSTDGKLIASAAFDNHVKLWNGVDGTFLHTLRGHVGPVYQCAFSWDSRLLVSGSKDTTVKVWNVKTGKLVEDLPGHDGEVFAIDWSVDGRKVGSGGSDKAVRLWTH